VAGAERGATGPATADSAGDREPARTGGRLIAAYLAAQRDALVAAGLGARDGDPDAVHAMRTASRRLRSTLRTFRPLWPRDTSESLRAELSWLGRLLGAVRDTDVLAELLAAALDAEDPALIVGPIAQRIERRLAAEAATARGALAHALAGDRYAALLDRLDTLIATPPPDASYRQVRAHAREAVHRADRRLDAALGQPARSTAGAPDEPDRAALHDARKAYKQARYAAEALAPVAGRPAERLVRRLQAIQDVLGDAHDAWVAADVLRDHAMAAHLDGENAFSYGILAARRTAAAAGLLTRLPRARRRAREPGVRAWIERR
jgi:CHAD domain-containing protein